MQDITPIIAKGSQVIEKYGNGSFTISQERHEGSVIVFPKQVQKLPDDTAGDKITLELLSSVLMRADEVEVLLVGTGEKIHHISTEIRSKLSEHGISADVMDTGAACRTYNVLLAEGRLVAAILIAV